MFKHTTITQRLLLGFGAVIGLLVAVVAVGLAYLNSVTRQVDVLEARLTVDQEPPFTWRWSW